MIIEDGMGSGKIAGVSGEQRLLTEAITIRKISSVSHEQGKSYSVYFKHAMVAAATDEFMGYMVNTGSSNIILSQCIAVTTLTAGVGVVELMFASSYTSGGNVVTPLNLNRNSTNVLNATCYAANATPIVGTIGSAEFVCLRVSKETPSYTVDFQDSVVLGPGKTIGIQVKSPTIADAIRVIIHCYED